VFVVMCLAGAAVAFLCRPLESEQARQTLAPLPETA
jgi:hypothetical protein